MGPQISCGKKPGDGKPNKSKTGHGRDLDEAVRVAIEKEIEGDAGLFTKVSLTFACEDLPKGMVVVLYRKSGNQWNKLGQTEIIEGTMNPKWIKSFEV